jgi:hypothetical protein
MATSLNCPAGAAAASRPTARRGAAQRGVQSSQRLTFAIR